MRGLWYALLAIVLAAASSASTCSAGSIIYAIGVTFNDQYQPDADAEILDYLRTFDPATRYISLTSNPPHLSFSLEANGEGLCNTLNAELESRSDVATVHCWQGAEHVGEQP